MITLDSRDLKYLDELYRGIADLEAIPGHFLKGFKDFIKRKKLEHQMEILKVKPNRQKVINSFMKKMEKEGKPRFAQAPYCSYLGTEVQILTDSIFVVVLYGSDKFPEIKNAETFPDMEKVINYYRGYYDLAHLSAADMKLWLASDYISVDLEDPLVRLYFNSSYLKTMMVLMGMDNGSELALSLLYHRNLVEEAERVVMLKVTNLKTGSFGVVLSINNQLFAGEHNTAAQKIIDTALSYDDVFKKPLKN